MPDGASPIRTQRQRRISPHPGKQMMFLSSAADIVIYGGGAGSGKSWGLLMEALRYVTRNAAFCPVIFRRTITQIKNPGGLWDQGLRLYPAAGAIAVSTEREFRWRGYGKVKFGHLEHEQSKLDWQGSEIPYIGFDELTHFTASQFWYMLSRNRSVSGIKGYVRATTNPDADSWVADLIEWWIDPVSGLAIEERCGVIRWFARIEETLYWADDPETLKAQHPGCQPKSLTFISADLDDNPSLAIGDPGYRANLMALQRVERERLLGGNWRIRASSGNFFQTGWVEIVDAIPAGCTWCRGWDFGSTEADGTNDPDWTSGTLIGRLPDRRFIIADHVFMRGSPHKVRNLVLNTAKRDGHRVIISLPRDPGQAGKWQTSDLTLALAGYQVKESPESGEKTTRFGPFSAQAEAGNVMVLRNPVWNDRLFGQLELFPEGRHDDDADSTSRAFNELVGVPGRMNIDPNMIARLGQRPTAHR